MPRHRRPYLDQFAEWAENPFFRMRAVETGFRSGRRIQVAELHLVLVEVIDAYDPCRIEAYRTPGEALAAALTVMAEPDSRGLLRAWVEDDGKPRGELIPGGQF
jgi:hypothetical protein